MIWIAPSEKNAATYTLEKKLWDAATQLWAGAGLNQSDYSEPILGLIFLSFAEGRFSTRRTKLEKDGALARRGSKVDDSTAHHAEGVLCLPAGARFAGVLQVDYLKANTGGSPFSKLFVDAICQIKVLKPTGDIIARFAAKTDAIFKQVNMLHRLFQNLHRTCYCSA